MRRTDVVIPAHCPISAALLMPVPREFLATPLKYIAAEHMRQRCICAYLKQMAAERKAAGADAKAVVGCLTEDLHRHREDEDVDLFPILRKRALREDDLDTILEELEQDHAAIDRLAASIVETLIRKLEDDDLHAAVIAIGRACGKAMADYAACLLRHLSIETNIVLVLARKRLTAPDLAVISKTMTNRRGWASSV